ncbi:MAG: hypothetical protein ACR2N3_08865 [Pyrinomonadaceae bacterium]
MTLGNYQFSLSQKKNENLILLNSLSKPSYEELARDMDFLAANVYKTAGAVGYIVIYGGSDNIENAFYKQAIVKSMKFRAFDENKFLVITSTRLEKPKFEFWISNDGTKPNVKEETFDYKLSTDKPIKFVEDLIKIVKIDGKESFYSASCEAGCITLTDFAILSDFLVANPQLNSYVIVHAKNFNKTRRAKRVLSERAFDEIKILPKRLKFLYGGKNKINENGFSEIEIYLATDESQLPKSKNNLKNLL